MRAVLEALATGEARDALSIARDARRRSATVYPTLALLEDRGWVTSSWQDGPDHALGGRRRVYTLTTRGAAAAYRLLAQRRRLAIFIPITRLRPVAAILQALPRARWGER
jgi:DNA-binding PadR family transcriptional regulator